MQKVGKKRETLANVRNLCSLLCQEAMGMGLLTTNYGQLVQIPKNDTIGATPFSSTELKQIWAKADEGDTTAAAVLILNYTGMRPVNCCRWKFLPIFIRMANKDISKREAKRMQVKTE